MVPDAPGRRSLLVAAAGLALILAATTIVLTWPLFRNPATTVLEAESLYGPAARLVQRDINLTMWVLAWDTHALATDPLRLFHANAMWPAPCTLAMSEHMLGNVPFFAPVYLATGNPVLAHQATLLASFVVAGLTMAAWAFYWTGDRTAAAAGAFLFAFAPFRVWQLGNLHVIAIQWLPLVLLGIDAALDRRAPRAGALALFAGLALSTGCSYYVGYAAFLLAGVYLAVGLLCRGRTALAGAGIALAAVVAAGAVLVVLSLPYLRLRKLGILTDYGHKEFLSLGFLGVLLEGVSGTLTRFLRPLRNGIPLYVGLAPLILAGVGAALHRRVPRAALFAAALAGFVLSLGPMAATPLGWIDLPYRWLTDLVPGFSSMRVPQRFGALVTLALVALGTLGLAALRRRLREHGRPGLAAALAVAAVAWLGAEVRPQGLRGLPTAVGPAVPRAYGWLAEHGDGGPLIELPASTDTPYRQSISMYFSTFHWLPLANGYTSYPPASFTTIFAAAARMPSPEALREVLAAAPIRWVLVRRAWIEEAAWPAWQATLEEQLRLVEDFGYITLYERR